MGKHSRRGMSGELTIADLQGRSDWVSGADAQNAALVGQINNPFNRANNPFGRNNPNRGGFLRKVGVGLGIAALAGAVIVGANTKWFGLAGNGDDKSSSETSNEGPQSSSEVPQEGFNMFRYGANEWQQTYGDRLDPYNFANAYDLQNTPESIQGAKEFHMQVVRGNSALADHFLNKAGIVAEGDVAGTEDQGAYLYEHRKEAAAALDQYEDRVMAADATVGFEDGAYVSDQLDHASNVVSPTDVLVASSSILQIDLNNDGEKENLQAICGFQERDEREMPAPVYVPEVVQPAAYVQPAPVYEEAPYVPVVESQPLPPTPEVVPPTPEVVPPVVPPIVPPHIEIPPLPPLPPIPPIEIPPIVIPPIQPPVIPPVVPPVTPPEVAPKIPGEDINVNPNVIDNPDLGMGDFRAPAPTIPTEIAPLPDVYTAPAAPALDNGLSNFTGPSVEPSLDLGGGTGGGLGGGLNSGAIDLS